MQFQGKSRGNLLHSETPLESELSAPLLLLQRKGDGGLGPRVHLAEEHVRDAITRGLACACGLALHCLAQTIAWQPFWGDPNQQEDVLTSFILLVFKLT